jgi:hypothetical protein
MQRSRSFNVDDLHTHQQKCAILYHRLDAEAVPDVSGPDRPAGFDPLS